MKTFEEFKEILYKEECKIKKVTGDLNSVIFYCFRYCLGRMTYAPSTCSKFIRQNISLIHKKEISLMIKEIDEYEAKDFLGNDCDVKTWKSLQDFLLKEITNRNEKR